MFTLKLFNIQYKIVKNNQFLTLINALLELKLSYYYKRVYKSCFTSFVLLMNALHKHHNNEKDKHMCNARYIHSVSLE